MNGKKIKCVVWDLDNTVWDGVLAEDGDVKLRREALKIITELDRRGILNSISSKNSHCPAINKLKEFGIDEFFLCPQVGWNPKSEGIKTIRQILNFGIDAFAFVDDQQFELDEVAFSLPDVLCIHADAMDTILEMDEMNPRFVTKDSVNRRKLYMNDAERGKAEDSFKGSKESFLETLGMIFTINEAAESDLKRVEELTVRTHQLNSTGTVYSYEELLGMINSPQYSVLVAQLEDRYGDYGKIGISVIEKKGRVWELKLLLMSCRVISKGVGSIMLNYIMDSAYEKGVVLFADFVPTEHNRIMYITYKFAGFEEAGEENGQIRLKANLEGSRNYPGYVSIIREE